MKRTIEAMQYGDRLDADPEGAHPVKKVLRLAVTGTNTFTAVFEGGIQITAPQERRWCSVLSRSARG